jgi:hypothetical protein
MSTHRSSWKRREAQAAGLFGARRQILSGSSGRDDRSASDTTHSSLFVEVKLRQRHAVATLFQTVRAAACREQKIPVLGLASKGKPGLLLVVDSRDLPRLAEEYARATPADTEERDDRHRS